MPERIKALTEIQNKLKLEKESISIFMDVHHSSPEPLVHCVELLKQAVADLEITIESLKKNGRKD